MRITKASLKHIHILSVAVSKKDCYIQLSVYDSYKIFLLRTFGDRRSRPSNNDTVQGRGILSIKRKYSLITIRSQREILRCASLKCFRGVPTSTLVLLSVI